MKDTIERENQLRTKLHKLSRENEVIAIKGGTEVEDMEDKEIALLRRISLETDSKRYKSAGRMLPLVVKIGGPEARRDIRMCLDFGVDCILGPMIESVYALDNFVETTRTITKEVTNRLPIRLGENPGSFRPTLAINIETITAFNNLDAMLFSKASDWLSQITIGRGDFSKSMHQAVDSPLVMSYTNAIIEKARSKGLKTSVGGGLSIENIGSMCDILGSDRFNTRHLVFANTPNFKKDAKNHVYAALRFEQELYGYLGDLVPSKKEVYLARIKTLNERLNGNGYF